MNNDPIGRYQVALTHSTRLNNRQYLPLLERCGGMEGFFMEKETLLKKLLAEGGMGTLKVDRESWLQQADREMEIMLKEGIYLCSWESTHYPRLLTHCVDAPLILFFKGTLEASKAKTLAIVGTRKASERCKSRVDSFLKQIAEMHYDPIIISGLAFGIDVAAHQAALHHGLVTRAVMGHGLHMVYPSQHRHIAEKIIAQGGCLISEYPTTTAILPVNFLQRNRIVAGMSEAVLIAESATKGGAMATARQAFSYDRTVMAIPGRPDDRFSSGCNQLIKENVAALVEETGDLLRGLNWEIKKSRPFQTSLDLFAEPEKESLIIQILTEQGEQHIDQLAILSDIPVAELSPLLLKLELEGVIVPLPGKYFTLL